MSIDLESMIELNVTALTRLTAAAVPGFVERGNGIVINISSIVALSPETLNGTYSGTKAYVLNLTQSLHHEVGDKGVQLQAVLPGATSTAFWDRAGLAVEHLPAQIVMTAEDMVDAALAGLDQRELVTIPSLAGRGRLGALQHRSPATAAEPVAQPAGRALHTRRNRWLGARLAEAPSASRLKRRRDRPASVPTTAAAAPSCSAPA